MPSLIVLLIVLPLLGTVGIAGMSSLPRLRRTVSPIGMVLSSVVVILVLSLRWMGRVENDLFSWQPSFLLGGTPVLRSDLTAFPLVLSLALTAWGAVFVEASREDLRPRLVASALALPVAGFIALWATTPLAMIIGWALFDVLHAAGGIAAGGTARAASRSLISGSLATLFLWAGTLFAAYEGGSALWSLMDPSQAQMTMWMIACILRLWVYPFHIAVPGDPGSGMPPPTTFLGPVIGWGLCLRLVEANGGQLPGGPWVLSLAAITLVAGSLLAWASRTPRSDLPWIGMRMNGAVLLAAGLAGQGAAHAIAAGYVVWVLAATLLYVSDGLRRESPWWSIPTLIGALALLGAPPTLGFGVQAILLDGVTREFQLGWGAAVFFGNLFLVPVLVRWLLLLPAASPLPTHLARLLARSAGLGLPVLLLLVAGIHPPWLICDGSAFSLGALFTMPGLAGWFLWVASLASGAALAWQERAIRPRIALVLGVVYEVLRLEWLYGMVVGAMDRGLSALRAADEVIGGAGALLWSLLLFLLILLVWSSR